MPFRNYERVQFGNRERTPDRVAKFVLGDQAFYHGLSKNEAQMFCLMALSNLYLARRCLTGDSA